MSLTDMADTPYRKDLPGGVGEIIVALPPGERVDGTKT